MTAQPDFQSIPATRRAVLKWLLGFSIVSTVTGILGPIIAYLVSPVSKGGAYTGPTVVGKLELYLHRAASESSDDGRARFESGRLAACRRQRREVDFSVPSRAARPQPAREKVAPGSTPALGATVPRGHLTAPTTQAPTSQDCY